MRVLFSLGFLAIAGSAASQEISDIWSTTWDRSKLFADVSPSKAISFTSPGSTGAANIVVDDSTTYQTVFGYGASLTDSSALVLSNMKSKNSANYWKLLNVLFDATDGANAAGFTYIRVSLGASDFSATLYSYSNDKDTSLANFNINNAPSYLYSVIKDIRSVNSLLKIQILPWSPPGWMKGSGTMKGGSLTTSLENTYALYLLKSLQGFQSKGIPIDSISIQNEPQNNNPTYPTCTMPVAVHAAVGKALRPLMDANGFTGTKLIGYEHNWDDAGKYPVQLMQQAGSVFDGVAFHCYGGTVSQMDTFHSAYPQKNIYMTECAGEFGSDWWSDIKWKSNNLVIGGMAHHAKSSLEWNIAGRPDGGPKLPGTTSCGGPGCRPVATVTSSGTYSLNQEFYTMAQASKAIIPKDAGGPFGQRIGVTVKGSLDWTLVVGAYQTKRVKSTDQTRYSLVVLNWYDNSTGSWNPQSVAATIAFRGKQAKYTFPVGLTTLWWFAAPGSLHSSDDTLAEQVPDVQVSAVVPILAPVLAWAKSLAKIFL
ncbi:glycoside hydrolase family 30 protein [Athelia psychrophila]|uniref:Glycoside hydrolase family 30 protein n=1 Tax=Athelia psychrophila TaxID=1759441 RepID=A0A166R836_9AGAM|nr:glycoside hydrolase family 30 protein [Fibularhizoctonia sp. CBS 109695]